MKTIQMAFANPLHFLKLPLLLAIMLNFSIGEPHQSRPIGDTEGLPSRKFAVISNEICGGEVTPRKFISTELRTEDSGIPIGGKGSPRQIKENPQKQFAQYTSSDSGGYAGVTAPRPIGGPDSPRHISDIGDTNGTDRRNLVLGEQKIMVKEVRSNVGGLLEARKTEDIGALQAAPKWIEGNSCSSV